MPRRRPASSASARRRLASAPPPWLWCPASPLVTETNLTAWPMAANLAAVPAARLSQSSGCAPKAMTRSLAFCAEAVMAAHATSKAIFNMRRLYIAEFALPGRLPFLVNGRAAEDREQRADRRTLRHVLHVAALHTREETLDAVHGDVALGGHHVAVLRVRSPDVLHAHARGQDHALRPGELLADFVEAPHPAFNR